MKDKIIKGYKAFDKDFKCRGFQYKIGETYKTNEDIIICEKGFHFCKNALDLFGYYAPVDSKFAEVKGAGKIATHDDDSKVVCSEIHINTEMKLDFVISAGVKFILDRVKWTNSKKATNTGDRSAAEVSGQESIACGLGIENKVKGAVSGWLVLTEWEQVNNNWQIKEVKSVKVNGKKIKADIWYMLKNGEIVEADK